jgi:hypothetical protein
MVTTGRVRYLMLNSSTQKPKAPDMALHQALSLSKLSVKPLSSDLLCGAYMVRVPPKSHVINTLGSKIDAEGLGKERHEIWRKGRRKGTNANKQGGRNQGTSQMFLLTVPEFQ